MEEKLGTIVSTAEGPSTTEFGFVVSSPKTRKGQFVELYGKGARTIAVVQDIRRANRYFERAESVMEYEKSDNSFLENFPANDWEYIIADCAILGSWTGEKTEGCNFPPSPGQEVFEADGETLKRFLGFDEGGLMLGKLFAHDVEVRAKMDRILQKHLAVLGQSGSGKSYATATIVEELLERTKESGRLAVIVFDIHGEYSSFAMQKNRAYAEKTRAVKAEEIKIGCGGLYANMFKSFSKTISSIQTRELDEVLERMRRTAREKEEAVGLDDIIAEVESSKMKENVKEPLVANLKGLKKMRLFGKADSPGAKSLLEPGRLTVVDFSGMDNERAKQIILDHYLRKLFSLRRRKKNEVPPFAAVIEEAHNFASQSAENSISREIINKIAREGRKFGACLCLVSQRPAFLSQTALSQCNSFLVMRITNPNDLKYVGESCEGIDSRTLSQISGLKTGEGILLGSAVNQPVFFKVRKRKSIEGGTGKSLEIQAEEFEAVNGSREQRDEDVDCFID